MASPVKPVLSSASKLLTNVCRVCGNAFCDNNKNKCNLFQGKNSAIKPDFTVALEKLTGPITPGDYLLSVCLQCKRLLDRYHRCSGEVERIARSIQEKARENDRIRMKRCSAAAPSQEAKRQRVSPPATQSGAGGHPLNAVSPSIPTIGVADDRPPDSVSTAAQTSVLHPVPVSTTAQTNILLSAPASTAAQTSVLQLAPICTTAQTSVFSTAPQTSVLHSTPVSSTTQMSILHPPPVSTATQTSVLNPGPASSAAQTSALKITPVSAATQTTVLRPPPVSTAAKTSARHSVPVSIAPKASVLHLAPVPAAIHAAVLRPSPVPAAIHASVLQPLPVSVASQTGIIHSAPVSTTPQTSLLHTTPVSIAPKTSLLPSSPVPGSIQGKQTKVIVRTPSSLMTRIITGPLEKVVDNLVRGRYRYLVKSIMSVPDLYNVMVNEVLQRVEKECKQLTSLKFNSILRQITPSALNEFKWNKALAEWRTAAPTFLKFLACASTASVEMTASDTRGPTRRKTCAMAMAGATLLKARAAGMCAPMYRNSLVLSHSGARKRCFDQFSKLSICVSHVSTLKKLKEMGGLSRESPPPHRKYNDGEVLPAPECQAEGSDTQSLAQDSAAPSHEDNTTT